MPLNEGAAPGGAFVTKLNTNTGALVFSALIHGASGRSLALDASNNVYLTGNALSTGFPRTSGAFRTSFGGGSSDAYVAKLSSSGATLLYSTYIGGSGSDQGNGIRVDTSGQAYVTGVTNSANFPVTSNAFQKAFGGGTCDSVRPCDDGFVTTLRASGSGIAYYSTYLGGNRDDIIRGITLDSARNTHLAGQTFSSNFPSTAGALQISRRGSNDAFVSKIAIAADVAISKTDSPDPAVRGSTVKYTIRVSNLGPDASQNLVLTDTTPASTTFSGFTIDSGSCAAPAVGRTGTLTCKKSSLAKGTIWTVTMTVRVQAVVGTSVGNTARIKSQTQDLRQSNNASTARTLVK